MWARGDGLRAVLCSQRQESADSEKVVGRADEVGSHLRSFFAFVSGAAEVRDGLGPTEDLLDAFRILWLMP